MRRLRRTVQSQEVDWWLERFLGASGVSFSENVEIPQVPSSVEPEITLEKPAFMVAGEELRWMI